MHHADIKNQPNDDLFELISAESNNKSIDDDVPVIKIIELKHNGQRQNHKP